MSSSFPAKLPEPPYYAVIFPSIRKANDETGYQAMAEAMVERASLQPGFLGIESVRNQEGQGITVSYWTDEKSIAAWKSDTSHAQARKLGRAIWYGDFALRVAKVERAYSK